MSTCKYPELMELRKKYCETLKVGDVVLLRTYESLVDDIGTDRYDEPPVRAGWCNSMIKVLGKQCTINRLWDNDRNCFSIKECTGDWTYSYEMLELPSGKKLTSDFINKIGTVQGDILVLPILTLNVKDSRVFPYNDQYYLYNGYYIPKELVEQEE